MTIFPQMGDSPKILLVTANPPYPTRSGDRQRTHLLGKALATVGRLHTICITPVTKRVPGQAQLMRENFGLIDEVEYTPRGARGPWRVVRPLAPAHVDRAATAVGRKVVDYSPDPAIAPAVDAHVAREKYDLVVGRYLRPAARAGLGDHPPCVLDVDDLDTQMYASRLGTPGLPWAERLATRWHLRQLQSFVPAMLRRFDHLWVPNPDDIAAIDHPHVSVLPNLPFDDDPSNPKPPPPPRDDSRVVLTVATMAFDPNVRGVDWFVTNVWPAVCRQVPAARFRIVGGRMSNEMKARWGAAPGVDAIGSVDDVRNEYDRCAISVAPVLEGGGTKIKVAESLRFGRVPVVHRHAFRGYERILTHGQSVWVGENAEGMVDGCVRLLTDPTLRNDIAARGAEAVKAHLSFDAFRAEVERTVERVLRKSR